MRALLLLSLFLVACPADPSAGDDDDATPDYPDVEPWDFAANAPWYPCPDESALPDEVEWATVFDREDSFFGNLPDDPAGTPNRRDIDAVANLPTGDWKQVGLWFQLDCPASGRCDHWDRAGSLQMALDPDAEEPDWVEVSRFVTPYNTGMCQFVDVTPMANLLQGRVRFRDWIDTWVNPGHSDGEGWRVTAKLVYWPGPPGGAHVSSIWGRRSITVGEVEDDVSVDAQITPVQISFPGETTRVEAHIVATGHGFGNSGNCAEFCQMNHRLLLDGDAYDSNPWRPDCAENPVSPQAGTWEFPRNGWCPGVTSVGEIVDITDSITPGEPQELDFDILLANGFEYDNGSPAGSLPYTLLSLKLYAY
jgi:hypothetical protein